MKGPPAFARTVSRAVGSWISRCAVVLALTSSWACGSAPSPPPASPPAAAPGAFRAGTPGEAAVAGSRADRVVRLARALVATPYRYAGASPGGFDCSGLTSYVFGQVGVSLPRTASGQASSGAWVAPDELAPGDLVFFGDLRSKPSHVGVVVSSPGQPLAMIHSSTSRGVVQTSVLSSDYWLRRLRFGRRVLAD